MCRTFWSPKGNASTKRNDDTIFVPRNPAKSIAPCLHCSYWKSFKDASGLLQCNVFRKPVVCTASKVSFWAPFFGQKQKEKDTSVWRPFSATTGLSEYIQAIFITQIFLQREGWEWRLKKMLENGNFMGHPDHQNMQTTQAIYCHKFNWYSSAQPCVALFGHQKAMHPQREMMTRYSCQEIQRSRLPHACTALTENLSKMPADCCSAMYLESLWCALQARCLFGPPFLAENKRKKTPRFGGPFRQPQAFLNTFKPFS